MNSNNLLFEKISGCLYGGAIGDAMGAPVEWKDPNQIKKRWSYITDFVDPWDGPSDIGKGNGRYTDDTHMVQVLSEIYLEIGDHLDAFLFSEKIT